MFNIATKRIEDVAYMRKNLLSRSVLLDNSCAIEENKTILTKRVPNLLSQYNIDYCQNYEQNVCNRKYVFDFYVPEYKILIISNYSESDVDVLTGFFDEYHIVFVKHSKEEHAVKELRDVLQKENPEIFNYEGEVYKQCRCSGFPYPKYTDKRMLQDWDHLCMMSTKEYKPQCRYGISIIGNFHKSIYDCSVDHLPTPIQGWYDDSILKYVITNRFIYQDTVNPSKVLSGLNISKKAPIVSRFNPMLARYLVKNYLHEFDTVFDPFSGFSGRLLGSLACGRKYIGQDIRQTAVNESNEIIKFLSAQSKASVTQRNVLESNGSYPCLLTCPPYAQKEIYGSEVSFKSCDEWIDECLQRFNCKAYVFVVDETQKYKEYVAETIQNSSHFSKAKEHVVVISK